jgi:hypothetical protein
MVKNTLISLSVLFLAGGLCLQTAEAAKPEKAAKTAKVKTHTQQNEKLKGVEKQQQKKMDQERKELDEGSEHGMEMRDEHSKKWSNFE